MADVSVSPVQSATVLSFFRPDDSRLSAFYIWGGNSLSILLNNLVPSAGSTRGRFDTISFDAVTTGKPVIWVTYPDGSVELAFDGTSFTERYASSQVSGIGTYSFVLKRTNGWYAQAQITAEAIPLT